MKKLFWLALILLLGFSSPAFAGSKLFNSNAVINGNGTITFPLFEGRRGGETVWFLITEASDGKLARRFGVPRAKKLRNARKTAAVQSGYFDNAGVLHFTASVDFLPERNIVPGPDGFPPIVAEPGAVGEPGYSPLVRLPNGKILNAPHVQNDSGVHDSVTSIDTRGRTVDLEEIEGFARDKPVLYISTEASDPVAAALESSTYTPALNAAPFVGGDGTDSSRASLAAITNGQTGIGNPQRQGLNSALLGEGGPRNMLAWLPNQGRYSPLWDVHLSTFVSGVRPTLQTDFF